jgi:KUP system potassium uptake protein
METSIQFANDAQRPRKSTSEQGIGGVVPLRQRSRSALRTHSIEISKSVELEDAEDEDAGLRDGRDYKKKQVRKSDARTRMSTS